MLNKRTSKQVNYNVNYGPQSNVRLFSFCSRPFPWRSFGAGANDSACIECVQHNRTLHIRAMHKISGEFWLIKVFDMFLSNYCNYYDDDGCDHDDDEHRVLCANFSVVSSPLNCEQRTNSMHGAAHVGRHLANAIGFAYICARAVSDSEYGQFGDERRDTVQSQCLLNCRTLVRT